MTAQAERDEENAGSNRTFMELKSNVLQEKIARFVF